MLKILFLVLISFLSVAHADTKLSLMASAIYTSPNDDDVDGLDGVEAKSDVGFGVGFRALMGISDQLSFRSGAGLFQKKFSYEVDGGGNKGDIDLNYVYLNIPLTLYWKASSQVGFFGGTAIQAKLSDDCDSSGNLPSCSVDGEKTLVLPAIVGFDFSFTDKFGIELSYEYGLTETAKDITTSSAVASILYHLE